MPNQGHFGAPHEATQPHQLRPLPASAPPPALVEECWSGLIDRRHLNPSYAKVYLLIRARHIPKNIGKSHRIRDWAPSEGQASSLWPANTSTNRQVSRNLLRNLRCRTKKAKGEKKNDFRLPPSPAYNFTAEQLSVINVAVDATWLLTD